MLKESGVEFGIIEYLKTPPSVEELDLICKGLGLEPVGLVRSKDKRFKELELSKSDNRGREEWLKLMVENPSLIERPIVIYGNKYAMGRPPESIRDILN